MQRTNGLEKPDRIIFSWSSVFTIGVQLPNEAGTLMFPFLLFQTVAYKDTNRGT